MIGKYNTITFGGDTLYMGDIFRSIIDGLTIQQKEIYIDSEYMYNSGHLSLYVRTNIPMFSSGKVRYDYANLNPEHGVQLLRKNINANLSGAPLEVVDRLTKSMKHDDPYDASEELFPAMRIIINRQQDQENKKFSTRLYFLQKLCFEFKKKYSNFVSGNLTIIDDNGSVGALKNGEPDADADECEACKIQ